MTQVGSNSSGRDAVETASEAVPALLAGASVRVAPAAKSSRYRHPTLLAADCVDEVTRECDGVALPTVASLCRALGKHLHPADGFVVSETPVTAVHVSELVDPTSYVSGGELLLTTGLILPTSRIGWEGYVSRLKSIGIAALGIGLGPRYSEPPEALVEACKASGLTLLIVPDPTPFLTISKTYWTARARSSAQHLQDEVAAHRALIDAAASPDPPAEVLRRLARAVDGWAASLTSTGSFDQIIPPAWSRRRRPSSQRLSVWRSPVSTRPRRSSRGSVRGDLASVGRGDRGGLLGRRHDGAPVRDAPPDRAHRSGAAEHRLDPLATHGAWA